MPGTPLRTPSAADARRRSIDRSGPKILIAKLALEPEIMWSMRWLIGCPKVTATPGIVATARRISVSNSSFGRPRRSTTSISAPLTPCRCSSRSARPVRRLVDTTSSKASSDSSTWRPRASLSSRVIPGGAATAMVRAPSLNSGIKVLPNVGTRVSEAASASTAPPDTRKGWSTAQRRVGR